MGIIAGKGRNNLRDFNKISKVSKVSIVFEILFCKISKVSIVFEILFCKTGLISNRHFFGFRLKFQPM